MEFAILLSIALVVVPVMNSFFAAFTRRTDYGTVRPLAPRRTYVSASKARAEEREWYLKGGR